MKSFAFLLLKLLILTSLPIAHLQANMFEKSKNQCQDYCFIPEYHKINRIFISNVPANKLFDYSSSYTTEFIQSVWQASGKDKVTIHLSATNEGFKQLKVKLFKQNPWLTEKKFNTLIKVVKLSDVDALVPWQRDFFKFNQLGGQQYLSYLSAYNYIQELKPGVAQELFNAIKNSVPNIQTKDIGLNIKNVSDRTLNIPASGELSGMLGGNIEPFIEDSFMMGNRGLSDMEWDKYSQNLCPKTRKAIKIDTDWLQVGHVDEIFKVIKAKNGKSCNWTILYPDTLMAMRMLSLKPNENLIDYPKKILTSCPVKNLKCEQHLDLNKLCIFSRYLDQSSIVPEKINTKAEQLGLLPCDQLKFASFDFLLNYTTLRKYNHIIQQKINLMLGELKKKAREFQPSCKEFDILPVPALYYNLELLKRDVMQLAKLQSEQRFMSMQKNIQETTDSVLYEFKASNVFPNLINHLQVGNTLISPFPYNLQLQNYFLDEMGKRGFKVISLDTLHFGHVGRGDVHCTTNTQTSCSL